MNSALPRSKRSWQCPGASSESLQLVTADESKPPDVDFPHRPADADEVGLLHEAYELWHRGEVQHIGQGEVVGKGRPVPFRVRSQPFRHHRC